MKQKLRFAALFCLSTVFASGSFAQEAKKPKGPWKRIDESSFTVTGTRYIKPTEYLTFSLDVETLRTNLATAKRITDPAYVPVYIDLPKPDGSVGTYKVYENETMAPELAAAFPEIRSYDGVATDNSGELVKFDLTPQGFHAMTLIPGKKTTYIDPYSFGGGDITHYIVYSREHIVRTEPFVCHLDEERLATEMQHDEVEPAKTFGNCTKRTYSLALSATGEYTAFHGGTVALAQAAQVTTINRVNGVYMRDLAVTLTIIANNNILIFTNAGTDPFTNGNPGTMITQNQNYVNTNIGAANYDVGHVFGTNSGGLAGLGVVCNNSQKASGVTGSAAPIGDPFDIDYVAHELGHQFSGNHSFRGNAGACSGNANNATAMEPGSGSSIMAYAGICTGMDVQPNSDDYFHGVNLAEMHTFLTGTGNSCATTAVIAAQSSPTITGTTTTALSIPANTPFALTATATDPDGDVLTYCWEQMNNQSSTQPPVASATGGPNFRSLDPSLSGTRYFPSISSLMSNGPFTWEVLPSVSRTMNFRVVVRDNEVNGGCNDHEDITISTVSTAGPFVVNNPTASGITWPGNSTQTVTWSVANTASAPVSCANVDIYLSTDGGATFSVIADNVPNDGSQDVNVPNTASTTAIIMVMCENGTFFDVSNNMFTITAATNDYSLSLQNTNISACQGNDAVYTVVVNEIGTDNNPVTLGTTGMPAGVSVNFSPNPAMPGTNSTMTVSNTAGAATGTYNFNVTGTSATGNHTTSGTLLISSSSVSASTLTLPVDTEPSAPVSTVFNWTNGGAGLMYDIEIATDAAFTTIVESQTGLTATTYTATSLIASTTYYWRVSAYNSCATAVQSSTFSFTTASCGSFASTNVPVTISSSGTPTVSSTLTVSAFGTIDDLNVSDLIGTHSWISDLTFTLTSPSGTSVTLISNICDDEDNFDFNLDDEAAPGALPCPPVGGSTYQPENPLSAFDGQQMNGVWTLTLADAYDQDGGALSSWTLDICYTPTSPCNNPTVPILSGTTSFCAGTSTTISIASGTLNDATDWQWYSGSCGGTNVGSGTSLMVSTPGTYYVRGEGGCVTGGTCQSVTVTQTTVNAVASVVNNTSMTASPAMGTYQWLDCNNGMAVVATSQNYTPTVNGSYAVAVTQNGCTDTSSCVTYNFVGLEETALVNVSVFPNPTTGEFTVSFASTKDAELTVTDVTGRLIRVIPQCQSGVTVNLLHEAKGVYFLNIQVGNQLQTIKVTKQ